MKSQPVLRKTIHASIARTEKSLRDLALSIHRDPELGYQEKNACRKQVDLLREWGWQVTTPFCGLETAYRAVKGRGRPTLAYLAEYDALPEIGHGCGHNLIGPTAIGAGQALSDALAAAHAPGAVAIIGTPAEERFGGKIPLMARGAFKGLDAVLMAHPSVRTGGDGGSLARQDFLVTFTGRAAHASGAPERGINALNAVQLMFHALDAWRQHLPSDRRIHGIITEGGVAANIVPARAAAHLYLRALDNAGLEQMRLRFRDIVRGAALMTGARAKVVEGGHFMASRANGPLNEAFAEAARDVGLKVSPSVGGGRGSTDFGNVSQVLPGSQMYFGIATAVVGHTPEFARAAGTKPALDAMVLTAEALARTGLLVMTDASFRRRIVADFHHSAPNR